MWIKCLTSTNNPGEFYKQNSCSWEISLLEHKIPFSKFIEQPLWLNGLPEYTEKHENLKKYYSSKESNFLNPEGTWSILCLLDL